MSIEEAQRRADQDRSLVLWPRAMSYVPVGRLIDVQRFDDAKQDNVIESAKLTKINNAIEFVHADRERRGAGHVIGQWALPGRPEVGQKVAWSGLPQAYDGTSLDFRVDYHGHAHEKRDVPKDAPFILIRESDNTVVGVFTTKAEAVRALDTVKRDQPIEQTRARDWSQELTMPKPPR